MKKCFQIISLVFFCCLVISCAKEETVNNTDTTVGHSTVTFFPVLTMKGATFMAVPMGGTYTDPGVTAVEGANVIPVTTTGSVNTATAGVYRLTYSAVNKDGFASSVSRVVAVYSTAADAVNNDLSGTYLRPATAATSTWTKIAPGVYTILNPGGAAGNTLVVIGINPTGFTIKIPSQVIPDGTTMVSANEAYNPATGGYSWNIVNPGYGTALRTFIKQ